MKLPIPESYGVQGGNQPYAMGYDIYVLGVADHIATVGNEKAGIKAQFAIPQEVVESEEWGAIPLEELYLKAAQQQKVVGNTVWRPSLKIIAGKQFWNQGLFFLQSGLWIRVDYSLCLEWKMITGWSTIHVYMNLMLIKD